MKKNISNIQFLKTLSTTKEYILNNDNKKYYNPHVINSYLSMLPETLFFADYLNRYNMNPEEHYKFLFYGLKKQYRYFEYKNKDKEEEIIQNISKYYNISTVKAREYYKLLNKEQIEFINNNINELNKLN